MRPALTDFRLFWTTVAAAMAGKDKLLLDEEPGRRRHLVVPDLADRALLPAIRSITPEDRPSAGSP